MVDSSMFNFPRWLGPAIMAVVLAIVLAIGFMLGRVNESKAIPSDVWDATTHAPPVPAPPPFL